MWVANTKNEVPIYKLSWREEEDQRTLQNYEQVVLSFLLVPPDWFTSFQQVKKFSFFPGVIMEPGVSKMSGIIFGIRQHLLGACYELVT